MSNERRFEYDNLERKICNRRDFYSSFLGKCYVTWILWILNFFRVEKH